MPGKREWLIGIRKSRRLTQQEIADQLDLARSTYAGYENGYRTPYGKDALRIANFLRFPVELFFYNDVRESQHRKEMI